MQSSHSLERLSVAFSDSHAVADAGLLLPATLAEKLGLRGLFDQAVDLGGAPGRGNAGVKALTLVYSALAGGDCIDDAGVLRAGRTRAVLGQEVRAPSTLGTFLRSFQWGHALQLDVVSREALSRAWRSGAGPKKEDPLTIDLDSTICETYGLKKAGGSRFTYTHVRGYHPLLAALPATGEVVHARLRGGPAHTAQGTARFIAQTVSRVRGAGHTGVLTLRADAGFYAEKVVKACRTKNVCFSITVPLYAGLAARIAALAEASWSPIAYPLPGAAVAEMPYVPFGKKQSYRLIVRRVPPSPGSQLALFAAYGYHAFLTDREGDTTALEADHRRHAEIENVIRDLKYGVGLNHLPSGKFGANAAWLALQVMAHNLGRWVGQLAGTMRLTTKTLRTRLLCLPGRITRSARRSFLALPTAWPWREAFARALLRLRALPPPAA
jgi:hypothetical protein